MHESITCSTKILTLTIAPFLFLLVGAKCVHFIVPSGGRGTLFFLSAEMYTFSSMFIKKILTDSDFCLAYDYAKVIDELEKTQTRNSAVLGVYNETKKHFPICFWFQ